ncbi:MAG: metallophosphoesterase [Lachnospiraceae bacterium]|nr:metallophosphoesterase [Lachnospiraceae bacterium]
MPEEVRIVQISDIHYSDIVGINKIQKAIQLVNAEKADVIVLTGDYITYDDSYFNELTEELRSLKAQYGIYAIWGNHDYCGNMEGMRNRFEEIGVNMLVNENRYISIGASGFWLIGVGSYYENDVDLQKAINNIPEQDMKILLCHEPDFVDNLSEAQVFLQISGHSHGGQVRLPLYGALKLPPLGERYPMGLYSVNENYLYTSRGLGETDYKVRFNCKPEITIITLKK